MIVGLEQVKRADTAALILARLFQVSGEFAKSGAVVYRAESIPIALVGFLGDLAAAVQIGHTPPHDPPSQVLLGAAFCLPVRFENSHVLSKRFDAKQVAYRSGGFAISLQGIAVDAVFDPVSAGSAFEIGGQFSVVVAWNLSGNVDPVTQKLQPSAEEKLNIPCSTSKGASRARVLG